MSDEELPFNVEDPFDGFDQERLNPPRIPLAGLVILGFSGFGMFCALALLISAVRHVL